MWKRWPRCCPTLYVWRERHLVGLAPIEVFALGIDNRAEVLRADARQPHDHRGGDAGGVEEHRRARVERAVTGGRVLQSWSALH